MTRKGKFVLQTEDVKAKYTEPPTEAPLRTPRITALQSLEFALALVNRLLIGFVTVYMCWMCLRLSLADIPWHAMLCTLGFVCLMSEGLLAHYRSNAWTMACVRVEKTRTHWVLQLCGSIIGLTGIAIKLYLEELHFQSMHGQLGLATLLLCLFSLFSGLSALYASELKTALQPLFNKAFHNVLGLTTYTLAMASMYCAFETNIFQVYSLDAASYTDFRILSQLLTVIIFALSSYGPMWCLIYSKLWKCC